MRYPSLGQKTYLDHLLNPGLTNRGAPRCFIREGADPNEATLSLAIDIDRSQLTHDAYIISGSAMREHYPELIPATTADSSVSVEGGEATFLRFEDSGNIRIMHGWPGFSQTSWGWLIGTLRYERGSR